jgi:hypothetical protein
VTHLQQIMLQELQVATTPSQPSGLTFEQSNTAPDTSSVARVNSVQNKFGSTR